MIGRFRYRVKLEFPLHIYTLVVLLTEQYMYSYCSGVGTMGTEGASLHCTPKFRTCILCTRLYPPQVKDAAYVKILSKRFQLQDCIRFVQICTPHLRKRSDALGYLPVFIITAFRISGRLVAVAQSFSHDTYIRPEPSFTSLTS